MLCIVTAGFILAAGFGTRLRPLTEYLAKPLLPIGDRSAISHVASSVRACSLTSIAANAHFRSTEVAHEAEALGLMVSHEDELLGTAGGVRKAWTLLAGESPNSNLLVATCDVLTRASFASLLDVAGVDAALMIEPRPYGEGNVGVDREGLIVRFRSEVLRSGEVSGGLSLGVQCLSARMWEHLPTKGCLVTDLYMPQIRAGSRVRAQETHETWTDVGTFTHYIAANIEWLGPRALWVGANAHVEGSTLHNVVVGEGATLFPGAYRNCVVLPGARVAQPGKNRVYWGDTFVDV